VGHGTPPKIRKKNISKKNKQIKRKKQSLVLILVIWPPSKKIRALFLDFMDIYVNFFGPILDFLGYTH
jgi:hypothetical protein